MGAAMRWGERAFCGWLLFCVIGALAAGCASGPKTPTWLQAEPQDHPEERYVSGVGQGPDAETAAAAARAEVERKTMGETEGVEIAETFVGGKPTVHWALAVLDRKAALDRLAEQLIPTEEQLARTLGATQGLPPEQSLRSVLGAIALAQRRDALLARIANLGGAPPASETSPSRAALDEQLAGIKRALAIDVEAYEMDSLSGITGTPLEEIRRALAQEVLAKGFGLPAETDWGDEPAWLVARARIGFDRLELGGRDRFVAVEWEAALEIVDRTTGGQVVALLSKESRATHVSETEARRQAQKDAETYLAQALSTFLDQHSVPRP